MSGSLPLICENEVSDRYYRIINRIDSNNSQVYVFVGQVPNNIQTLLNLIKKGTSLNASQNNDLATYFGTNYRTLLGIDNPANVTYVADLIEIDDSIAAIKNKIAVYLRIAVDWQYLYANIDTGDKKTQISLGHTFIERKESKKDEDILIDYPKDPYEDVDLSHPSMNAFVDSHTGIKFTGYQKNDTHGTLITEYDIINNEIYLVTFCSFVKYLQTSKTKFAGINLNKLKFGYLAKYWPTFVLESESDMNKLYELCASKGDVQGQLEQWLMESNYKSLVEKVEADSYIISLIKDPPAEIEKTDIKFENCGILEIVLHINYNLDFPEFIDLMKIFDRYHLNKPVPFVKYKGEKSKEPRHKLYIPIIEENSIEIIQDWISNIQKRKKDDIFEYRVSGKGLSFKRLLYQNIDNKSGKVENKYATINFYKDGKIELKCFWEEHKNATLSDVKMALIDLVTLVNEINKIEYHLPGIDRKMRIPIPDLDFINKKDSNTQIAFINTVTRFNYGDIINFDKINDFASCFNTFVSIIRKNIALEYDPTLDKNVFKTIMSNSLQLRYKRINNYLQMSIVEKFIHDILKQTEGVDKLVIVKLLAERFNIVQEVAEKIYVAYDNNQAATKDEEKFTDIDYVLGKKIRKQPGIDIKVQGQEADKYKIFILGAKSILQLSLIHRFLKSLLSMFKRIDLVTSDPTFKAYTKKGLCKSPETLIDEGINESMDAYKKIEKHKKVSKITSGLDLDLEEGDLDDIMALMESEDQGPSEADIEAELKSGEELAKVEEEEEEEDIDEEETEPVQVEPPVKKPTKFDYTKGVTALMRLKDADPDLFKGSQYATTCQSNAYKQPMVINSGLYKEKKTELEKRLKEIKERETQLNQTKSEGYQKQLQDLQKEKNNINYKLEVYKKGVEYRKNYYFCPLSYEYSTERVLHPDEIDQESGKDPVTGNPIYWVKKKVNLPHAGFAPKDTHPEGELCIPCCYGKPHTRFDQCLGTGGAELKTDLKSNIRYILAAEKTGIPVGRFGMLPETMNLIFNNGVKSENKIMAGYDSYLRKGINPDPSSNIFLNAVGDALSSPIDGFAVRKLLANRLNLGNFLTLKSGALKLVFQDDKDPSDQKAFENFSKFITADNYIDEDFLWDYITMPGVLTSKGFNLFIFESQGGKGKISENIILKCPVGYDVGDLYNNNKVSLVLFKYGTHYEPIYKIMDSGTIIKTVEMFPADHLIIKKLISMSDQCSPELDLQSYSNEELLLKKINQTPLVFEEPYTLKKTVDRLGHVLSQSQKILSPTQYGIKGQIIDNYNKATYLVLANGFKIPVKPSSRMQNIAVMKYEDVSNLDYEKTITILKQLSDLTSIPLRPLMALTDSSGLQVIGILLNNGLSVEVESMKASQLKSFAAITQVNIPTVRQYYQSRNAVDRSIALSDQIEQIDERSRYVNLRQFEDESYQRLRYELSKELQEKEYTNLLKDITTVIQDVNLKVDEKRNRLSSLLIDPIKKIIVTKRQKEYDYDDYRVPNVRTQCGTKSKEECEVDPHCESTENDGCKLFIEPINLIDKKKDNINRYLSLIVEELLKNHLKRTELITDQVDNTVDEDIFEYRPDEALFKDSTYKENKKKLERLYKTDTDYYERLSKLYDTANPAYYQELSHMHSLLVGKMTESSCVQGFETLTVYWGQIVGPDFRRLNNDKSTNCIYYALSLALSQRDGKKGQPHTIQSIRGFVAENIENLKDEEGPAGRKGWELLLDHYRFMFKERVKDIYSLTELKDYMKSDAHQASMVDLIMIAQLYDIKLIIMSRRKSPFNPSGFICVGSTTSVNDNYVLLYKVDWEDYQIVGNTNFSPPKYIFSKEELPTKLYQHWAEVCGKSDLKNQKDEAIPLLFKAPLYKTFDIAPVEAPTGKIKIGIKPVSAKSYFVDPTNQEILSEQTPKKIPLKPKISISLKPTPAQTEITEMTEQVKKIAENKKIPLKKKEI